MEKRVPHYPLKAIQRQMRELEGLYLTQVARQGMYKLSITTTEAIRVIQAVQARDFFKSMTTYQDHTVWQDVYHPKWKGEQLYIKFQKLEEYYVVSFKERNDG